MGRIYQTNNNNNNNDDKLHKTTRTQLIKPVRATGVLNVTLSITITPLLVVLHISKHQLIILHHICSIKKLKKIL